MNNIYVYLHINPLNKKPFYVGIGTKGRAYSRQRNKYHKQLVKTLPNELFNVRILYPNVDIEFAYRIEKQIIAKCGRICNGSGFLTNIHPGGPLEHTVKQAHWCKGKTMKQIYGNDWVSWRTGKTYHQLFGDKAQEISDKAAKRRSESFRKRLECQGRTQKEIDSTNKTHARRMQKQYTKAEMQSFERASQRQQGKTMKQRLNDPSYVSKRRGKTMSDYRPNWVNPRKGKTLQQQYGADYVDKRSKPFAIISSLGKQSFNNEREFIDRTGMSSPQLIKLRTNGLMVIKRNKASRHCYENGDTIRYIAPKTNAEFAKRTKDTNGYNKY